MTFFDYLIMLFATLLAFAAFVRAGSARLDVRNTCSIISNLRTNKAEAREFDDLVKRVSFLEWCKLHPTRKKFDARTAQLLRHIEEAPQQRTEDISDCMYTRLGVDFYGRALREHLVFGKRVGFKAKES